LETTESPLFPAVTKSAERCKTSQQWQRQSYRSQPHQPLAGGDFPAAAGRGAGEQQTSPWGHGAGLAAGTGAATAQSRWLRKTGDPQKNPGVGRRPRPQGGTISGQS